MDLVSKVDRLYEITKINDDDLTEEDLEEFEGIVLLLSQQGDINIIQDACKIFNDRYSYPSYLDSLSEAIFAIIKRSDLKNGLLELAKGTPKMLEQGKKWAIIIYKKMLSVDSYVEVFRDVIKQLDEEVKKQIITVLEEIKDKKPDKYEDKVNKILFS